MIPAAFDYLAPQTLDEAVRALAAHGEDAKILAGGQSLLPLLKLRLAHPKLLIDLSEYSGLERHRPTRRQDRYRRADDALPDRKLRAVKKKCPLLPQTARAIGDVQVRNRGTIGGSLTHADPSADWPAAILALGRRVETQRAERRATDRRRRIFSRPHDDGDRSQPRS